MDPQKAALQRGSFVGAVIFFACYDIALLCTILFTYCNRTSRTLTCESVPT